jgi:hypothetical protein
MSSLHRSLLMKRKRTSSEIIPFAVNLESITDVIRVSKQAISQSLVDDLMQDGIILMPTTYKVIDPLSDILEYVSRTPLRMVSNKLKNITLASLSSSIIKDTQSALLCCFITFEKDGLPVAFAFGKVQLGHDSENGDFAYIGVDYISIHPSIWSLKMEEYITSVVLHETSIRWNAHVGSGMHSKLVAIVSQGNLSSYFGVQSVSNQTLYLRPINVGVLARAQLLPVWYKKPNYRRVFESFNVLYSWLTQNISESNIHNKKLEYIKLLNSNYNVAKMNQSSSVDYCFTLKINDMEITITMNIIVMQSLRAACDYRLGVVKELMFSEDNCVSSKDKLSFIEMVCAYCKAHNIADALIISSMLGISSFMYKINKYITCGTDTWYTHTTRRRKGAVLKHGSTEYNLTI